MMELCQLALLAVIDLVMPLIVLLLVIALILELVVLVHVVALLFYGSVIL